MDYPSHEALRRQPVSHARVWREPATIVEVRLGKVGGTLAFLKQTGIGLAPGKRFVLWGTRARAIGAQEGGRYGARVW